MDGLLIVFAEWITDRTRARQSKALLLPALHERVKEASCVIRRKTSFIDAM